MSENRASDAGIVDAPAAAISVDEPVIADTATAVPAPKSRSGSRFLLMLNFIILLAVAVLGYAYWQQRNVLDALNSEYAGVAAEVAGRDAGLVSLQDSQQQMSSRFEALQTQLQQTTAQLAQKTQQEQSQQQLQSQLQAQLSESNSRIAGLAAQLNNLNSELTTTRQQVSRIGSQTSDAVLLNEAESLIELAQQRLLTAHDLQAAVILLSGSDELLARINAIDVIAARSVLAADLIRLKAVPAVDEAALYQQLANVRSMVNTLRVVSGSDNPAFAVSQTGEPAPQGAGWFDSALGILGEYFVVTRQDVQITPLLTTEQQFLIRQTIDLQLASAQLALLNEEPEVYRAALAATREGVDQWLQEADEKVSVLATLASLQDTPVRVDMPDISASLNAIRQLGGAVSPSLTPPPSPELIP